SILFTDQLENKIDYMVNKLKVKKFTLYLHPFVAAFVNKGIYSLKWQWRFRYSMGFQIIPDQNLAYLQYRFVDLDKQEIDLQEEIEIK
ncbi:MAG: ribonuclease E/G, partial [Bacteroidales bacterium]